VPRAFLDSFTREPTDSIGRTDLFLTSLTVVMAISD